MTASSYEDRTAAAIEAFVVRRQVPNLSIPEAIEGALDAAGLPSLLDAIERWELWSNSIAEQMPEHYDGDEAQEAIIDRWLDDLLAQNEKLREALATAISTFDERSEWALPGLFANDVDALRAALEEAP